MTAEFVANTNEVAKDFAIFLNKTMPHDTNNKVEKSGFPTLVPRNFPCLQNRIADFL